MNRWISKLIGYNKKVFDDVEVQTLKKRIFDLEVVLTKIQELCGEKSREKPLEIHVIIDLCVDNLKHKIRRDP